MAANRTPAHRPPTPTTQDEWAAFFAGVDQAVAKNPNHPLLIGKPEGNPVQTRPPWRPTAEAWVQGVQSVGTTRYAAGVRNPRRNFKSATLANNAGWKAGVQQAVTEDRFAKGMGAVNVDEAIETAATTGAATYASGASARSAKYQRKVDALAARMGAVVEQVRAMPATTDAEREQRMLKMVQGARAAARGAPGR